MELKDVIKKIAILISLIGVVYLFLIILSTPSVRFYPTNGISIDSTNDTSNLDIEMGGLVDVIMFRPEINDKRIFIKDELGVFPCCEYVISGNDLRGIRHYSVSVNKSDLPPNGEYIFTLKLWSRYVPIIPSNFELPIYVNIGD